MSYHQSLTKILTRYSGAIKTAKKTVSDENIIEYLSKMPKSELKEMLTVCEHMEEYEFCSQIHRALQIASGKDLKEEILQVA
ncbi:MAG: hypothetical protein JWN56_2136 [Sphingobacteriales bacterium]|nr:hypothetical protein [Sphingobacteriales bacterium]